VTGTAGLRRLRPLIGPAFDLGVPVVAYYLLKLAGAGTVTALVVAAALPLLSVAYTGVRHRRFDRAAGFTLAMVITGILAALVTGSVRLVFAKAALFTAAAGIWFLVSARTDSPAALALSRPVLRFVTAPGVSWDELWNKDPRFRRIWRVSSVIQGVFLLADAVVRAFIAYSLPVEAVPAVTAAQYPVFLALALIVVNMHQVRAGLFLMLRMRPGTSGPPPPPALVHHLLHRALSRSTSGHPLR
jgi:hypothetical protein